mgnify:CR=1 FL=1
MFYCAGNDTEITGHVLHKDHSLSEHSQKKKLAARNSQIFNAQRRTQVSDPTLHQNV